jgi:hypothetical protein
VIRCWVCRRERKRAEDAEYRLALLVDGLRDAADTLTARIVGDIEAYDRRAMPVHYAGLIDDVVREWSEKQLSRAA